MRVGKKAAYEDGNSLSSTRFSNWGNSITNSRWRMRDGKLWSERVRSDKLYALSTPMVNAIRKGGLLLVGRGPFQIEDKRGGQARPIGP